MVILINLRHFNRLWLWATDATPDRVGDDYRFGRVVFAHVNAQEKRQRGGVIAADEAPAKAA